MKLKKYLTIAERREYLLKHEMPISFDPTKAFKRKSNRKYVTVLATGGDSSLFVKVKKGTRMLFGSGEYASFGQVGTKKNEKQKILSKFKKRI